MSHRFFTLLGSSMFAVLAAFTVEACGDGAQDSRELCVATVASTAVVPAQGSDRPTLGNQVTEPLFGPCVQRVSDHAGHDEPMAVHGGARAQAFNADGTAVLLRNGQVLRLSDRKLIGQMPAADTAWVWSNDNASVAFAISGNQLHSFDFATKTRSTVATFPRYERLLSESGLWLPSQDGTWALGGQLAAPQGQEAAKELFLWNPRQTAASTPVIVGADRVGNIPSPRWLQSSPNGKGFVVAWSSSGINVPFGGVELYGEQGRRLRQLRPTFEVCDLSLDAKSSSWLVCAQPPTGEESSIIVTKHALDDVTPRSQALLAVSVEHNVELSCVARGTDTCVLSAVGANNSIPLAGEVTAFSLESRPSQPLLWRLAHHRSSTAAITSHSQIDCPIEASSVLPHATMDRSGKRVLFGSNWATNCFAELYLIDFR
jgi:hypothetical protein